MKKNLFKFLVTIPAVISLASCKKEQPKENYPKYDEPSVVFHYSRTDNNYEGWDMWIWEVNAAGAAFEFNGTDTWGAVASYPLSTWTNPLENGIGFLVRQGGDTWAQKDLGGADLFIDFSVFEHDENDAYHVYLKTGDSNVYVDTEGTIKGKINYSTFTRDDTVVTLASLPIQSYSLKEDGVELVSKQFNTAIKRVEVKLPDSKKVDYLKKYTMDVVLNNGDNLTTTVTKVMLYKTDAFSEAYSYDGELGAIYTSASTQFKVWSPISTKVVLRVYNDGTPEALGGSDEHVDYTMVKGEKGVFSYTVNGDLEGKYYTYIVSNDQYSNRETIDPYAKSCGVNGVRGMIVDFSKTNPQGWDDVNYLNIDRKAMTVYETHIADVTSSSTWGGTASKSKKFSGMYETGTTYTEGSTTVKTGFDHIKELGVNAVQLVPIFDQANDELNMTFNWGYNPLNYNCLEGGYSSDPKDGYARIREFKELVKGYNNAGISIIMDVVYNHTSGAIGSNFDILMPGYYYRYDNNIALSNGSGCGNEMNSENSMVRKFMLDSIAFWTSEYKLGGYRFDLMGLHDLDTMEQVTAKAKEINPYVVIYGEPWQGGTSPLAGAKAATQANGNKYVGYGAFNDKFRDAMIAGGLAGDKETGWVTDKKSPIGSDKANQLIKGIKGITQSANPIEDPDKSITYVTCHDNYTLRDRFIATGLYSASDEETLVKMNVLANSVVFTSQGTAFMLGGEEIFRTKQGSKNSYNLDYDVNEFDYSQKIKHPEMFESYKALIEFKQNVDGLHLNKDQIGSFNPVFNSNKSIISYNVIDSANGKTYTVYHQNGLTSTDKIDLTGANLYFDSLNKNKILSNQTSLEPYETLIVER